MPETIPIVLASTSTIRKQLLQEAGVDFETVASRYDEEQAKAALQRNGVEAPELVVILAKEKARKVSGKRPEALVIGCDQVLEIDGVMLSKAGSKEDALDQMKRLRGNNHRLYSAVVMMEGTREVWRHIGKATLFMRDLSDEFLACYIERYWDSVRETVGNYKIENGQTQLFEKVEGDYYSILGLPLKNVLSYLDVRGLITK